jgi:hypothetical protein
MKYFQILEVKNALTELGKERLPIAYEVAKNIRLCNKVIEETAELSREMFEKFADKDKDGKPVQVPDENNQGQMTMKITDPANLLSYQEEIGKILNADHDMEFVKIPKVRIQSEKLTATTIVPLIDIVIE